MGNIQGNELLQTMDALSREKEIDREELITAVEQAIQKASKNKYGPDYDIRVSIDRQTGDIKVFRCLTIVEEVQDDNIECDLETARQNYDGDFQVGDVIYDSLPGIDSARTAIQTAKQAIVQKFREVERQRLFNKLQEKLNTVIFGTVKGSDPRNVLVEVDRHDAYLPKDQLIRRENFREGDKIKAYVYEVKMTSRGPQMLLSRIHPDFLPALFQMEVPEINDGLVKIVSVARDPGSRTKIAVTAMNSNIDPIGACVGVRGTRVQAISNELGGEKIDIIPWSIDPVAFVVDALAPAEVSSIFIDEDRREIRVIVPDDQYTISIGRVGQNVKMASQLTGWRLGIVAASKAEAEQAEKEQKLLALFKEALQIEEVVAQLLIAEGFTTIQEIAYVDEEELTKIEGFSETVVQELQNRARTYLEQQEQDLLKEYFDKGGTQELLDFVGPHLSLEGALQLTRHQVCTLEDLGWLDSYELLKILESQITPQQASDLIMQVRASWEEDTTLPVKTPNAGGSSH